LDYATRQKMLQERFPDILIASLPDLPTDEVWSKAIDDVVASVCPAGEVVLYGGRDSFIPYYNGSHKTMQIAVGLAPDGTNVRQVTANEIKVSSDFRAGMIYRAYNQYPSVFQTVDVAILRQTAELKEIKKNEVAPMYHILLGRKKNMDGLLLPGGFVSPTDEGLEDAARREAKEETGVKCGELEYVGSRRCSDWRYKHKDDGAIITALFACLESTGEPVAGDDLAEVCWVPLAKSTMDVVGNTHKPLIQIALEEYGFKDTRGKPWRDDGYDDE